MNNTGDIIVIVSIILLVIFLDTTGKLKTILSIIAGTYTPSTSKSTPDKWSLEGENPSLDTSDAGGTGGSTGTSGIGYLPPLNFDTN